MPPTHDLRKYMEFAAETVYLAGRLTLGYFGTGVRPDFKADDTPVTVADRLAEQRQFTLADTLVWSKGQHVIKGGFSIGGQEVALKNVTCPILNIYALQDHLVPPDASRALKDRTGSADYTELAFPGGHIGIYVSGKAQKEVTPAIGNWLNDRS